MKNETEEKKDRIKLIILATITVILLWIGSWFYIDYLFPLIGENQENIYAARGAFGDKFGFINSLFSGLALTGIIISIYFQQNELSLQRKELINTREEFKDQNFQTTFFNLLKTQREIAQETNLTVWNLKSYKKEASKEVKGRDFFIESKIELKKIIEALDFNKYTKYINWSELIEHSYDDEYEPGSEEEEFALYQTRKQAYICYTYKIEKSVWEKSKKNSKKENAKLVYSLFLNRHHYAIGHYFRHLYHILNFLNEKELEQKKRKKKEEIIEIEKEFQSYANFAQAQMSIPELFLIYYNSLIHPKLKKLIIKYNFVENLNVENLLDEEHNYIEEIILKRKLEL